MFGHKKKQETPTTISHPILGEMKPYPEMFQSERIFDVPIFGKTRPFYLLVNSDDYTDTHAFTVEQEAAIAHLVNEPEEVAACIEGQLRAFFPIEDDSVFREKLTLVDLTINSRGELAAFFDSEFDDEVLVQIDPEVYFTESFGVVVYPEARMLYNEMDCYTFDN